MKVHTKLVKAFGVLLVVALLFAVLPVSEAMAQTGSTISVSQPIQVTDSEYYERGQAIVYDESDYWLFYGRSKTVTGNYQNSVPDVHDYAIFYKKASSVGGLAAATATAVPGAENCYNGEIGAAVLGGKVWTFCSPDPTGSLYGYYTTDGSSWTGVAAMATGMSTGAAHHDEVAFDGKLFVMVNNPDSLSGWYTKYTTTPELNTGWSSYAPVNATTNLVNGTGHFFVDGDNLYIGLLRTNPTRDNFVLQYNSSSDSWTELGTASSTGWDATLFKAGSNYVFAQAPWVNEGGGRQYIYAWTGTELANVLDGSPTMVSEAMYGSNTWGDMWPIGFTDYNGDSFLFITSERDEPDQEGTGNIWYLEVDWDTTQDHFTYIQNAIDAASDGDTINVYPGTYQEQVVVNKDLTLVGTGDPTITPPTSVDAYTFAESSASWEPVVLAFGGTADGSYAISGTDTINFSMSGFVVDGADRVPSDRSAGILLRNVDGVVSSNTVQNMYIDGKQTFGIIAYGDSEIIIDSNTVSGYARGGIAANGDLSTGVDPVATITNNTVTGPGMGIDVTWAPNGIQIGWGATGLIQGNMVSGNGWPGTDWSGSGIIVAGANNVTITGNTASGNETGIALMGDPWYGTGYSTGTQITNNVVQNNTYGISVQSYSANTTIMGNTVTGNEYDGIGVVNFYDWEAPTGTVVEKNKMFGNNTAADPTSGDLYVSDDVLIVDASPNWWGSMYGPTSGQVVGDADYVPWCGDPGCTFFLPDENGVIELSGTINVSGGIEINAPGLTYFIKQDTVINNGSPCFIVNADNVTIEGEYPGEEYCIPTGDSAGVEVAADVSNLVIKNLDFDGSSTTGSAIDFAGDVDGVQIVNNYFHDFIPSAIVFGGEVLTEHVIQGNMFMDVGTPEIVSDTTTTLDASFNSWGENAAPTIAKVTTSPFTHANLWMESSGAFSDDQVAKGETITYTVYADLTEISGAEFTLTYPASLLTLFGTTDGTAFVGIPDDPSGTKLLLDKTTPGQIKFAGIVPLGNDPVTGTDVVLFTATFTAADPVPAPNTDVMSLVEISQGFSMTPDDPYYTNHVYPAELLDGEVTVIELPTIDSTDIDGYYLVGDTQEFNVQTTNPADGGDFSKVLFKFEVQADEGDITLFQYDAGGTWYDMPLDCTTTPGICVGYYGPSGGFPLGPSYTAETTFQVQFAFDDNYPVEITLVDLLAGDKVLTTFSKTSVVYTKPIITSTDIGGPYTAEVEKCFTLTIDNVDADMIADGLVATELSFDFPDGTVISYDGSDYTCTSGGCPLIPVTLTAGLNELEFCVTFPTEFDDDITVTLFDTDWDPDRELASKTFAVKVYANWSVEGKVTMQGRTYRGDVPMTLTGPIGFAFGPFTEDSLNQMGLNIFFTDIAEETYTITTDQDRYLNVMGYSLLIDADITLPDLYLYGGNANWDIDNVVDISDASIIGAQYGTGTIADNGDVNFDNRVNIQDLAIVGGNYGLDGAIAYASWLTP